MSGIALYVNLQHIKQESKVCVVWFADQFPELHGLITNLEKLEELVKVGGIHCGIWWWPCSSWSLVAPQRATVASKVSWKSASQTNEGKDILSPFPYPLTPSHVPASFVSEVGGELSAAIFSPNIVTPMDESISRMLSPFVVFVFIFPNLKGLCHAICSLFKTLKRVCASNEFQK